MSNNIRQDIDTIEIPPQLHLRSQMGIRQAKAEQEEAKHRVIRWSRRKTVVALVLAFILITTTIFNTQVIAAIQKALQYFPGTGMVIEEEVPQERYGLEKPVTTQIDGGTVVITGMLVDEKMTYITMSGTNSKRVQSIKIINEQGIEFSLESSGGTWTSDKWARDYWYQGKLDIKGHVQVIIGENPGTVIPLTLTKAETFNSYQDMGETSTANGVTITAIANRVGERARISLVSQHSKEFRISDYDGMYGVHEDKKLNMKDETGKVYELEHYMGLSSPASEFYFDLSGNDVKTYSLTIPEINVTYDDTAKISFNIPSQVGIPVVDNKTFEIAGFPVKITKLERVENNRLRVYADLNYNENSSKALHNFKINASHMAKLDERTMSLEYLEFDIEPGNKVVKLTISDPEVVIRGSWKFELPVSKYFNQ
ncbi:DUF4179 domain-containing protein [Paenibacillus segetis]|uniref:DUF4179 domain-containing protein n=1 Tax=Paenibacillus segetis TaxID=1325360 RepID=A0ABQ1YAW6_9BACL|nr:DUF4179 domain-containing protein [Paenibacillus segetis]GGH18397.1 hypothetical protein GCM10008013_14340 [Paenibacillus segetis]